MVAWKGLVLALLLWILFGRPIAPRLVETAGWLLVTPAATRFDTMADHNTQGRRGNIPPNHEITVPMRRGEAINHGCRTWGPCLPDRLPSLSKVRLRTIQQSQLILSSLALTRNISTS